MVEQLTIQYTHLDNTTVVEPLGEVDLATADQLKTALLEAVDSATRVVVRMDQVTFLDSTGTSALVTAWKQAADLGGTLCLAALSPNAARTLQITAIDQAIPTYPQVESALDDINDGAAST